LLNSGHPKEGGEFGIDMENVEKRGTQLKHQFRGNGGVEGE